MDPHDMLQLLPIVRHALCMQRQTLARRAQVSRKCLFLIEAGRGNPRMSTYMALLAELRKEYRVQAPLSNQRIDMFVRQSLGLDHASRIVRKPKAAANNHKKTSPSLRRDIGRT